MILQLTTFHENRLEGAKSRVFNKSSGYFHGSGGSLQLFVNRRTK
jgi:hypothetical protein